MKLPKISAFALAASLFIISCGSSNSQTERTDSTSTITEMPANNAPVIVDTAVAPPATPVDSIAR